MNNLSFSLCSEDTLNNIEALCTLNLLDTMVKLGVDREIVLKTLDRSDNRNLDKVFASLDAGTVIGSAILGQYVLSGWLTNDEFAANPTWVESFERLEEQLYGRD